MVLVDDAGGLEHLYNKNHIISCQNIAYDVRSETTIFRQSLPMVNL